MRTLAIHIYSKHKQYTLQKYYCQFINKEFNNICPTCGKDLKFISLTFGFSKHCNSKCAANDINVRNKQKETCIKLYNGIGFASQQLAKKQRLTMIDLYNVQYSSKSQHIREKIKKTNIDKYGGTGFASQQLLNKYKKTCIEKYGQQYTKKIFQINRNKLKLNQNIENVFQRQSVKNKAKKTKLYKYGSQNYNNSKQSLQTVLKRYGKFNIQCSKSKYALKQFTYNDTLLHYQSQLQLSFIKYCIYKNILIYDGDVIDYQFEGKNKKYFVDFKVYYDDKYQLVQIKDTHCWFLDDLKTGKYQLKCKAAKNFSIENDYHQFKVLFKDDLELLFKQ